MSAGYSGKIEERIRDRSAGQDGPETILFHVVVDNDLRPFHHGWVGLSLQLEDLLDLLI